MENHGQFVMLLSIYIFLLKQLMTKIFHCRPQTQDDLNKIIPKHIQTFQLFVSDDILLYSLVNIF
jgi:hypothetical protein